MNKVKKILMMVLSLVLVAALSIGGTVAYLQDDDSDVNVMTLGSVKIAQHEYEREVDADGNYVTDATYGYVLKDFTQGKPLLPATTLDANGNPYNYGAGDYGPTLVKMSQVGSHGSMNVFVNENAMDKFVTVENTGRSDAYVRTIIAMEIGSLTEARFEEVISTSSFMTAQGVWDVTDIGTVVIDGNNYFVSEYLYNGAKSLGGVHENGVLPAGDTTYPSLAQVYMKATATNEDVEKIDGNKNGAYDILVLSQAVQTAGFDSASTALDTAFGDVNATNAAEWFGDEKIPVVASTQEDLNDALAAGKDVVLDAGTYTFPANAIQAGTTLYCDEDTVFDGKTGLNINGATVVGATFTNDNDYLANSTTINGTFKDCVFTDCDGLRYCYAGETVVFENCVFDTDFYGVHFDGGANEVLFKNCTFTGFNTFGSAITKLTMEDCTFKYNGNGGYNGVNLWGDSELTNCTFVFDGSASYEWVDLCGDNKTVTFTGCSISDGVNVSAITSADVGDYGTGNTIIIQ